jgi:hypothetical protein
MTERFTRVLIDEIPDFYEKSFFNVKSIAKFYVFFPL